MMREFARVVFWLLVQAAGIMVVLVSSIMIIIILVKEYA